ncbi:F-box/kelch-repeat protein At3g23880-like [Vicia villosa]|uniref:F-box/kelch-repeat protein At3g23880-like n=1 Tax=Vicia villosa TaxID=3911 RepID=UPI00273AB908|nr:F-box/kelch-repeat protein At3g23880-like [Vicia villosa]
MNPSPVILPNDLITEVLSILPVKSILRFKCVSKHWKTLISDHAFVKLHLKRSPTRNPFLALLIFHTIEVNCGSYVHGDSDRSVVPYPIRSLLDNPSITLFEDPYYLMNDKGCSNRVGSCNGLILLVGESINDIVNIKDNIEYLTVDKWLRVWNPATRTISKKFGQYRAFCLSQRFTFAFGCDNLKDTYKVVAYRCNRQELTSQVRVLSLGDDVWRNVESFPAIPLLVDYVYLSGTLYWLANQNRKNISVEKLVIISFDLSTETYNQYLPPRCFDEVSHSEPVFGVLGGCLSFSYSCMETDFIIWQMSQFGVEDSWTQLFKISYQNLQIEYDYSNEFNKHVFRLMPLFLWDDTLILASRQVSRAILYNWRANRVTRTNSIACSIINNNGTSDFLNWQCAKDYVESLVPTF